MWTFYMCFLLLFICLINYVIFKVHFYWWFYIQGNKTDLTWVSDSGLFHWCMQILLGTQIKEKNVTMWVFIFLSDCSDSKNESTKYIIHVFGLQQWNYIQYYFFTKPKLVLRFPFCLIMHKDKWMSMVFTLDMNFDG